MAGCSWSGSIRSAGRFDRRQRQRRARQPSDASLYSSLVVADCRRLAGSHRRRPAMREHAPPERLYRIASVLRVWIRESRRKQKLICPRRVSSPNRLGWFLTSSTRALAASRATSRCSRSSSSYAVIQSVGVAERT